MTSYTQKNYYQVQLHEKNSDTLKDEEDYENEDVISFCDLPMYNSSTAHDSSIDHHEDSFKESCDSKSSSDEDRDSLFEFFSDEWNVNDNTVNKNSSSYVNNENILFFGKILEKSSRYEAGGNRLIVSRSRKNMVKKSEEVVVPKVSVYTVPLKSKLFLVLFGLPPKVPKDRTEFMSDIRNRQSRHAPTTFFPTEGGAGDVVPVRRRSGENGVWRFVKAATCFGGQKHTNVIE
ncbi:hypothetical protein DCAR_0207283 [Daucus carota subsp. sativus]|uniref:Uncharacterized protein n=1 Tax=Daucus carota subsp. sativus TaxID=79200 RepID=A0A166DSL3_DAUCS|nr:hypothetical protein DCAR_0207283 [Daucus carota subsp. sativus]